VPLDWFVALRFLREGRMQSLLIVAGVGVGVGVVVFLSALIDGLQVSLIDKTLGTQAHVVLRPPDESARKLRASGVGDGPLVAARVEKPAQRVRSIDGWQHVDEAVNENDAVAATAPIVTGSAFAMRGNASRAIALFGVRPESFARVIPIDRKLASGSYSLTGTDAIIGAELARDLGVREGDQIRLQAPEGHGSLFLVRGIFDVGNRDVNRRWVLVNMRSGQTLLGLVGGASHIEVRVNDIFSADEVARDLSGRTGLVAESWMKTNSELLVGLRSQSNSSALIQVFVVIAVAMGIASVLIVSVVQKAREIGILRAMGTSRARVLRVFLLQGALVGFVGSLVGCLLGTGLALFFQSLVANPDGSPMFPVALTPLLMFRSAAVATLTGVLAASLPARRAARLEPAVAIRYE